MRCVPVAINCFATRQELVDCVGRRDQRIADDIARLASYADQIEFPAPRRRSATAADPAEQLPELLQQLDALKAVPAPATLKRALAAKTQCWNSTEPLRRLARDYCVLLREAETMVCGRGVTTPALPDDAARAARVCDRAEAVVTALAAAALDRECDRGRHSAGRMDVGPQWSVWSP